MLLEGSGASVRVIILDQALWTDRRAVMDSMMRASASVGKSSRTYLALPKTAASVTDAGLFQERGIGIFTYDHRNIDEALPARYFETITTAEHEVDKATTLQLENEFRELRTEFSMLEQTVQHLREELTSSSKIRPADESAQTLTPRVRSADVPVLGDLPAFFAGNPWIEVLSRRGREEAIVS